MQWRIGPFRLDLDHACLWRDEERVVLRPKTFDLLVYLVEHAGNLVTKDELLAAVWPQTLVAESALSVSVSELRKALGETARAPQFIATVHRRGYRFIAPTTPIDPPAPLAPSMVLERTHEALPGMAQMLAAERRQLTVWFCDLVDSTRLAGQLDPEDLREVLQAYHQTCAEVVERFGGYVAQYLGDGVLAYFGYPIAHEDDAQRAVWSALGLLGALAALNTRLALPAGYQLAVRLGLHTGLVVVSNVGTGERQERLAQGETPHIASRLQSLAGPNELVISATTRDLLGGAFQVKDVGGRALKGLATPMQVYRVQGAQPVESRFEAMTVAGLTPLVGREAEVGLLLRRWEQATEGEGQVVLLSGEAGLGKSRLTQTLCERLADTPHLRLHYQCSPYHTHSALYPIIAHLERTLQLAQAPLPAAKLDRLEALLAQAGMPVAEVAPLFAALLSIPSDDRYAPLALSPQRQKDLTMAAWVQQVVGLSQRQPVMAIFEDVQWSDPTTLEALANAIDRVQEASVLLLITCRSEFTPPWGRFAHVTTHVLNRLTRRQVVAMVEQITRSKVLPAEIIEQIVTRTDGVPLFVEELTKTVLESANTADQRNQGARIGSPQPLPTSLQDALQARLDRLLPVVKEIAQVGATLGREFPYALVAAVGTWSDASLREALDHLVAAGLLFRRGTPPETTYLFKHALVQDAAYASLLKSMRQQLHTRIALVLAEQFPAVVATQPEVLAHHYTEAGLYAQAIDYWQQAGQHAADTTAHVEAISHINKGLELLETCPETTARAQQELRLQMTLGHSLMAIKGYSAPEVEQTFSRARELCQQIGETAQLVSILQGLRLFYSVRGDHHIARALGEQLLSLAQRRHDSTIYLVAHVALECPLFWCGELVAALEQAECGVALYDSQQYRSHALQYGLDLGVNGLTYAAFALAYLGYPDRARQRSQKALVLAQELAHPFTLAYAWFSAGWLATFLRDEQAVQERAAATLALATSHGFPLPSAMGTFLQGWVLARQGHRAIGIRQMQQGLGTMQAMGMKMVRPYLLSLLAAVYGGGHEPKMGLEVLAEAVMVMIQTGERGHAAELYRLRGYLLRQSDGKSLRTNVDTEAEMCFQQALDIARHQEAKALELRAAMSLARLWQQQGKPAQARELLAPVYDWFVEGFDTLDLQEAKALLVTLS